MCCSLEPAELSDTIVSCIETAHPETSKLIHVAGYQNKATSPGGPNAMLLPFPSAVPMGPANVVDTTSAKRLLKDYAETLVERTRGFSKGLLSLSADGLDDDIQVFEAGSYHIVMAANAAAIPSALRFVPSAKRPRVNQAIFDAYAKFYPSATWQFALCCWNGAVDAEPMMWWYQPNDPDYLFLPGLDAHDGLPPKLGTQVRVDHSLIVGSNISAVKNAERVYFRDRDMSPALKPYIASSVVGTEAKGAAHNGDWRFHKSNFLKATYPRANKALFERVPPPSA